MRAYLVMACLGLVVFETAPAAGQDGKSAFGVPAITDDRLREALSKKTDAELRTIFGTLPGNPFDRLLPPPDSSTKSSSLTVLTADHRAQLRTLCQLAGDQAKDMSVCHLP